VYIIIRLALVLICDQDQILISKIRFRSVHGVIGDPIQSSMVYLFVIYDKGMRAKFKTTCSECNGPIKVAEEIAKTPSGKWVHKYCTTKSEELP
jgi:hypothetical protein